MDGKPPRTPQYGSIAAESHPTSLSDSKHSRRALKRNRSDSRILDKDVSSHHGAMSPVDKYTNNANFEMDKIPDGKVSAFGAFNDASSTSQLLSPTRHSTSLVPTVSSVVEKFNFGLKEKLKKAEKDNQELQEKYQELLKSLEFISSENDKLKSTWAVLEEDKKVLESKYHKLKSHTDSMKADYDRVNAKLSSLEVANESLKQTSWIRRSKRGKGSSADKSAAANEISILKDDLVKKDARISELEKEVVSVQEKLKQAVSENQASKSIKIKVDNADTSCEENVITHHDTMVDETVLNSLDKPSIIIEYKKLVTNFGKKELELKEHQDQVLSLEKSYREQKKELLMLNMEINKIKGDSNCVLSGSNNALHHSSSVTMLGVPSSFVKSASFDNGRRISLPARREAASSPDVSVLQSCLKLSLAEKKTLEEEIKELKQQLFSLKHEQANVKSSRSHSVITPAPSPSNSSLKSSRSQSTVVNPKAGEDTAGRSSKGDISMLQSCLQLAITEKKALTEENKVLQATADEWQQKAKSLETQLGKLEKLTPKADQVSKLKASVQSLEKENSALLDKEKKMHNKVKSLDAKHAQLLAEKTQLMEEIEKLNQKLTSLSKKEKQRRTVERQHKAVQTTAERSLERNRPGSGDSRGTSRVSFYRSNSQNSDPDTQADHKKLQVMESQSPELKVDHKKKQVAEAQSPEVKAERKKMQVTEAQSPEMKVERKKVLTEAQSPEMKKMQVTEGQSPEMKVACRLNITSHSPSSSPSGERHVKVSHTKSLTSDYKLNKGNRNLNDNADGESGENKFLSSSQPVSFKPAVTSVKVSTSIKKETPTKINALHLRNTSPQLHPATSHVPAHNVTSQSHTTTPGVSHSPTPGTVSVQSSHTRAASGSISPGGNMSAHTIASQSHTTTAGVSHSPTPGTVTVQSSHTRAASGSISPGGNMSTHTIASQSHTTTAGVSHSPTPGTVTVQSSHTRAASGSISPGGNISHSVQLGSSQQSTSHVTPSAVSQSSVTSSLPTGGTTQSSGTTSHQPITSTKPRPFYKSNTVMSFVTSANKSTVSPSHSPVVAQKSATTTVPTTTVTSPPKSTTNNSASNEPPTTKPPLQKTSSLTVNSGTEVVRRRPKPRSQQILDPMKRSSAYYPMDITSQSIMEENELHRCGSLESLKSALFHAVSTKVQPSVTSSSVSTASNVSSVNTTASTTAVTSTNFSSPTPKVVSFSKVQLPENKFETKPADAKKEVKFVNNSQPVSTRARPRAARHQSINTPLPPVSSYYSPSTPVSNNKTNSSSKLSSPIKTADDKPGDVKLRRSNTTGSTTRPSKKTLLLRWCQKVTEDYENVDIRNFSDSFSDGLAFCAIVHHFSPTKIPYHSLNSKTREKNFQVAFDAAEAEGIPRLLDVSDMVSLSVPDWMSVMTYVACIHKHFVM